MKHFMHVSTFVLAMCICFSGYNTSACTVDVGEALRSAAEVFATHSKPTITEYKHAIHILSDALARTPDNSELLVRRANYYQITGQYNKAYGDLNRAAQTKHLAGAIWLDKCMLGERVDGLNQTARACYQNVLAGFLNDVETGNSLDANTVLAAFLANDDKAASLLQIYREHNSDNENSLAFLFNHFNRQEFLHIIFP